MCNLKNIACGAAGIHIHIIESAPVIMNLHRAHGSIVEVTGRFPYTLFRFKLNMPAITNVHRAHGTSVEVTGRFPYTLFRFKLNMHQP